jgi:hypothetical protein
MLVSGSVVVANCTDLGTHFGYVEAQFGEGALGIFFS